MVKAAHAMLYTYELTFAKVDLTVHLSMNPRQSEHGVLTNNDYTMLTNVKNEKLFAAGCRNGLVTGIVVQGCASYCVYLVKHFCFLYEDLALQDKITKHLMMS